MESEQKDLIISQLKAEIYELSQNEQNCFEILQELQSLSHKTQILEEEKVFFCEFREIY